MSGSTKCRHLASEAWATSWKWSVAGQQFESCFFCYGLKLDSDYLSEAK